MATIPRWSALAPAPVHSCEATLISPPVSFLTTTPKSSCLGMKTTSSHCIPFLFYLFWLIAKFLIERAGHWVSQLYPKLMPDDTGLWWGWSRRSLSDPFFVAVYVLISLFSASPVDSMLLLYPQLLAGRSLLPLNPSWYSKSKGWLSFWLFLPKYAWYLWKNKNVYIAKCIYTASAQSKELSTSVDVMKTVICKDMLVIYNFFFQFFGIWTFPGQSLTRTLFFLSDGVRDVVWCFLALKKNFLFSPPPPPSPKSQFSLLPWKHVHLEATILFFNFHLCKANA